ncbi:MCE family protein [Amycolatopsis sp. K13G38]|uniref:MCE family protein n=1 Tax=Amycolatopsis acididurans TaxID=2724524 RepID=A0ABX1J390_9PSEU|nr:MlaD family protein [Amycolatopsis acididurans]NKQ54246.1 MCE family protein [Amycolatopsis acididurans]
MAKKFSARRTWQRLRTVPGLGKHTVAVLIVIVLGVTTLAVVMANVKFIGPWEDRFVFAADFDNAPAVVPSQNPKVRIAGVDVGQIVKSEVTAAGKARLTFSVNPGSEVYDNAHVVLRPKSAVNEMYVEVDPGGPPGKPLGQDAVIPAAQTARPIQPDEVLDHLDDRTRAALSSLLSVSDVALANAPSTLPAGLDATGDALKSFQPVADGLRQRREKVSQLVTALSSIATATGGDQDRMAGLVNSLQQTLGTLSARDDDLRSVLDQLPDTTGQLNRAMGSLTGLTGQLNPTLDNVNQAAGALPDVLRRTAGLMDTLGRTAQSARPVVAKAAPVVSDLGPLVNDLNGALGHLRPMSQRLDPVTATLVPYLNDVAAFLYNTSGVFAPSDADGGFVRGHLTVPLPDGGVLPGSHGGNPDPTKPEGTK